MTFAEFIAIAEEYNLDADKIDRLRFMIRDVDTAEFRRLLDEATEGGGRHWTDDEGSGDSDDGCGNRWIRPKSTD